MRYKVTESVLNEYVNHPIENQIDLIEADSYQEAQKIVQMRHPNRGPLTITLDKPNKSVDSISE